MAWLNSTNFSHTHKPTDSFTYTATEFVFLFSISALYYCTILPFLFAWWHSASSKGAEQITTTNTNTVCDGSANNKDRENIMPTVEHIIITNSFIYSGVMVRCKMTKHYLCQSERAHAHTHTLIRNTTKNDEGTSNERKEINKKGIKLK